MTRWDFHYENGELTTEGVRLSDIAAKAGTPVYVYSAAGILSRFGAYRDALAPLNGRVFYAMKANSNLAILSLLKNAGAGFDVVSIGEVRMAIRAGAKPSDIVFSGVGKSDAEIAEALDLGLHSLNVESEDEFESLARIARSKDIRATAAVRINPDVDAKTHAKITTGKAENKFGISIERARALFDRARDASHVNLDCIATHIGSQLTSLQPYRDAFAIVGDVVQGLRDSGHAVNRLDLGGGLGIAYQDEAVPPISDYADVVRDTVGGLGCELCFEPGRSIVGPAGALVASVVRLKEGDARRFVVVDAAMNDLVRPAMYDAYHEILTVKEADASGVTPADIVGPVCESGDTFAKQRPLPRVENGQLLAFMSAGAYGAVMTSSYNARPPAAEVLVSEGRYSIIRPREDIDAIMDRDQIPEWVLSQGSERGAA
jgi:diaminopimelate decarboxylase